MITSSIVVYKNNYKKIIQIVDNFLLSKTDCHVIVVDNSPQDNKHQFKFLSNLTYISNGENIGFGRGHNIAFKIAKKLNSKFHFIINPDIYFKPNVISDMISKASKISNFGLMMPKILYPNNSVQYLCKLLPKPADLIFRRFLPFKSLNNKRNYTYELRFLSYEKGFEAPTLSGCFLLFNLKKLNKINGFDPRFFMYMEDVDICRRMKKISKVIYCPDFEVIHHYSKGSYNSLRLLYFHVISAIKYFNKWGWFFDKERDEINKKIIEKIN